MVESRSESRPDSRSAAGSSTAPYIKAESLAAYVANRSVGAGTAALKCIKNDQWTGSAARAAWFGDAVM